jgi:hypothetical protein
MRKATADARHDRMKKSWKFVIIVFVALLFIAIFNCIDVINSFGFALLEGEEFYDDQYNDENDENSVEGDKILDDIPDFVEQDNEEDEEDDEDDDENEKENGSEDVEAKNKDKDKGVPVIKENGSKSFMVIATYPDKIGSTSAMWTQLECFASKLDRIIIAGPNTDQHMETINKFVEEVKMKMPDIGNKLEAQFFVNDRYDTGLWCDALMLSEDVLQKGHNARESELLYHNLPKTNYEKFRTPSDHPKYLGGKSEYDSFLLINDTIMAVESTNVFMEELKAKHLNLLSLNYWEDTFWLESPARAFNLEGMQIFADNICQIGELKRGKWGEFCPHLYKTDQKGARDKRCITELNEIDVVELYPREKVHGLFPGSAPKDMRTKGRHGYHPSIWNANFRYFSDVLRDQMSFPAMKVIQEEWVAAERPQDLKTCTTKLESETFGFLPK